MQQSKFNFQKYIPKRSSWKTWLRLIVYSVVIIVLFYLIITKSETKSATTPVDDFEIEVEMN